MVHVPPRARGEAAGEGGGEDVMVMSEKNRHRRGGSGNSGRKTKDSITGKMKNTSLQK